MDRYKKKKNGWINGKKNVDRYKKKEMDELMKNKIWIDIKIN